ncbi:Acriflavin resistance plasma membrane protein [Candidatus Burkholderia verschuerenii]|uniref:Acriflavin resistance plasma membrane protein n=1 Tax=Candidatus Burkholderia verschuerenii TaxID=242163 RepID=A0A0L0M719_9BURK|nr:efflux RND transporter permease subunit [Candidatus Burkholderia verschuerenii]KND58168.1 Acriflavin resistance plasma membrane protein [Candidatus Burkholderia verschuerenii]
MNMSRLFINRPVATTLLAIGIALAGMFAFVKLPVAPLPQVDFPTISVQASLPGASPETVATSVASPLERHLGTIADVSEMTSMSLVGTTRIVLQFGLNRDIDGAARDVQAAINAARADLPTALRQNPTYHKVNPADAPILVLALSSPTRTPGAMYDSAATVLQQTLSTVPGVGEVNVSGSANPAVRVELEPGALFHYGIGLEDVRAALASANANSPKGTIEFKDTNIQLYTNDQASKAAQYKDLVVAYRNGAAVKLSDVGEVVDSVEDLRNLGLINNKRTVLVILYRQPGANIIETIDRVKAMLPQLQAALPADIQITPTADRSTTIRASLHDTEATLAIAVALVVMVVFLRNWRATLIPSVAVPISIIGTFAAMYLLGFSLDNLSLMALTIATGFVVDDAIVVLENISRHVENGMPRMQAALLGASEVSFTVISMSISLVAVFLPILLMAGIIGRLFREFALTLSLAIAVSLVVSLTVTPMMCSRLLEEPHEKREEGRVAKWLERQFQRLQRGYARSLGWALAHPRLIILTLVATVLLNGYLYVIVPKGFFPQQDTGRIIGGIQADQSTSFQAMKGKFSEMMKIVEADPAVDSVAGFTGGRSTNTGFMFISLKPKSERKISADQVINRLRKPLADVADARTFLQAVQDIRVGGRQSNAQYQFTLLSDTTSDLYKWGPLLTDALQKRPELADVSSDQQQGGLEAMVTFDRATAARLNIKPAQIDNTLYDAFGQRQVSTIYNPLSQYHVVMELAPKYWQDPEMLKQVWISTSGGTASGSASTQSTTTSTAGSSSGTTASTSSGASETTASLALAAVKNSATNAIAASGKSSSSAGAAVSTSKETMVPLSAIAKFGPGNTPLSVNHQSQFVASTISFNLPPGKSLSDATAAIYETMAEIGVPQTIHGSFQGTAQAFQQSVASLPILIAAALAAVYIVLGMLYESYIHPITILSTLPSAGVGALLALLLFHTEFSIIAFIAVILLIGIVKKNAIMMVDFAIEATRHGAKTSRDAIEEACLLRFRPIMMTTAAALLGALPLAFGSGEGSEMRAPLGIAIVGGLIVSQMLTLYTTPVVYLYMDRIRVWSKARQARRNGGARPANATE